MAHKTATVIRKMLESSGRTEGEVNDYLGKDDTYVADAMSGKISVSPAALAGIAAACGFRLVVTNGSEEHEVASSIVPVATSGFETTGEIHDCEYSGKVICFTGDFYGLGEAAQEALCVELGARWVKRVNKAKNRCDFLVVGDLSRHGGTSENLRRADSYGISAVGAESFRESVEGIIGRALA